MAEPIGKEKFDERALDEEVKRLREALERIECESECEWSRDIAFEALKRW